MATKTLKDLLVVGNKVRVEYSSPDHPNNKLLHIRGFVDDQIVTRSWVKHKQRWTYDIHCLLYFEMLHKEGYLKKA